MTKIVAGSFNANLLAAGRERPTQFLFAYMYGVFSPRINQAAEAYPSAEAGYLVEACDRDQNISPKSQVIRFSSIRQQVLVNVLASLSTMVCIHTK